MIASQNSQLAASSGGYLHLDYLVESQLCNRQPGTVTRFARTFNHKVFTLLNQVCCIELLGTNVDKTKSAVTPISPHQDISALSSSNITAVLQRPKFKWPEKLVLFLCGLFTCHILIGLYYQYSYDFNLIGLMVLRLNTTSISFEQQVKFTKSLQNSGQFQLNWSQLEREFLDKIETSKRMLDAIGALETRKSIASETQHLCILLLYITTFGLTTLYYRYVAPLDLHQYREQIDYKRERKAAKELILEVVRKYCASDKYYGRLRSAQYHSAYTNLTVGGLRGTKNVTIRLGTSQTRGLTGADHRLDASSLLQNMLATGALTPANRFAAWTRIRDNLLCAYVVCTTLFSALFFGTLTIVSTGEPFASSLLELSIYGLMAAINLTTLSFYIATQIASIDQTYFINTLIKLIAKCIRTNSAQFAEWRKSSQVKRRIVGGTIDKIVVPETLTLKMNSNLLFTLIHYKIFVRQLQPFTRTLNPSPAINCLVLLLVPIIIKIHIPYMKLFQARDQRLILAGTCALMIIPINPVLLIVCNFNSRCKKLYISLSSLVTHIIEHENYGCAYDSHALLTLLKAMRQSNMFLDQFTPRYGGVSGTYASLVEVYFWWSMLVISILLGASANGTGIFDSIFDDPLGAYSV